MVLEHRLQQVRDLLQRQLQEHGCPEPTARRLAEDLEHVPWLGSVTRAPGPWLCLRGSAVLLEDLEDLDDVRYAVEHLVSDVVDDNAEAYDRTVRGEAGHEPLWPLPDRRPRRR